MAPWSVHGPPGEWVEDVTLGYFCEGALLSV
jgi:hypothetical protein